MLLYRSGLALQRDRLLHVRYGPFRLFGRLYRRDESPDAGRGSTHNWFHHCVFTKYGKLDLANSGTETYVNDNGTIRFSAGYNDKTAHNTFEDCVFFYGDTIAWISAADGTSSRQCFSQRRGLLPEHYGSMLSRNEPVSGYFGNRCIHISNAGDAVGTAFHNLIEGNRIGFAGTPPDDDGSCDRERGRPYRGPL